MSKPIIIDKKIYSFKKKIFVSGDKSLSIRWALLASQATGISKAFNLLESEDVINTLKSLRKLGVKVTIRKNYTEIVGNGINSFNFKKNIILDAGNSGTLGRLILALLIKSPYKIKLTGDESLKKRDFSRVINPLKEFGANFYPINRSKLPIYISGSDFIRPINFSENKSSAQIKSSVMLAALNSEGKTKIKAKKSRDHTELLFKFLKIPIKIKKTNNYDLIEIEGKKNFKAFNYNIPSDISSSAFFIVLTLLSKNSSLTIKNVNINPSRTGSIKILNKMGANIKFKNIKNYRGEKIADIHVKSVKSLKPINCPSKFNSSAIDEFLIIFIAAAKARGVSYFKNLSELNQKESPRLVLGNKLLNKLGIKTVMNNNSIKIYGNPNYIFNKNIEIKNFLKDHRYFMTCVIAALIFSGKWKIHDPESIKTSFPSFLKIVKSIVGKIN
ncbi:MAG: 3-phosphoshikimate 1-carboxyvinyltransferase [Candidatus Pelagibacter sp. TMED142]|nr:MAG: 3-phosphoshikimate 1-carboxyvinyltransferase [Candidatus Pelagibacter sp. TMED142]|tara:strand:+ start:185 stop:1513 length:1329 start_codon:yes stop_codon:yes gene_type:complete